MTQSPACGGRRLDQKEFIMLATPHDRNSGLTSSAIGENRRLHGPRSTFGLTFALLASAAFGGFWPGPAAAQGATAAAPGSSIDGAYNSRIEIGQANIAPSPASSSANSPNNPGFFAGILERDKLLGDIGGLRTRLDRSGVTLTLLNVSDVLGNTTGGINKGVTYSGLTWLTLQMDTKKAFGWDGGLINISGLQIRGRSLSQFYLDNLQTVTSIAASNTTRIWEIWYQQAFADGKYDVKIGQQSIDLEFTIAPSAAIFLNASMGFPALPSLDLFAAGPTYPLSSLGLRFRAQPTGAVTVLAGVFQDNPPGGSFSNDSELLGSTRWGGNFNLRTGALFIAEIQYRLNQPGNGDTDHGKASEGLPGTYKLGAWFDTASFQNQRYDTMGIPLASPGSNGIPQMNLRNYSLYGLADQMIWRPDPESPRSLNVFARAMAAPNDRNLINFSVNAGVNLKAPLPGRDDDTFGVGFGVARISSYAAGFNKDTNFYGTSPFLVPVRGSETFLEVTYLAQVTPAVTVQPDFQYIFNPGGGIANPNNPELRVKNEAVFGVRTIVTF